MDKQASQVEFVFQVGVLTTLSVLKLYGFGKNLLCWT
jgi:hypothetical protein